MSSAKPEVVIVIPARYGSTRLPGKPLVLLAGKPMIQRVYERAKMAERADRVIVATDDERIVKAVESFGGDGANDAHRPPHRDRARGGSRSARKGRVFVNVQGDEPLLDPAAVDTAVDALLEEPAAAIATVATPIKSPADIMDPNVVKTVLDFETMRSIFRARRFPGCATPQAKSKCAT